MIYSPQTSNVFKDLYRPDAIQYIILTELETATYFTRPFHGAIAQLGERLHGMQEVGGSIPPGSTRPRSYRRPHRLEAQDIALSRR